jgi:hypothetical protein
MGTAKKQNEQVNNPTPNDGSVNQVSNTREENETTLGAVSGERESTGECVGIGKVEGHQQIVIWMRAVEREQPRRKEGASKLE